jgi:hypothetical protein
MASEGEIYDKPFKPCLKNNEYFRKVSRDTQLSCKLKLQNEIKYLLT